MNKFIFFILILLAGIRAYPQYVGAQYRGASLIPVNLEIHDLSGRPLPINDRSNIDGSPLLSDIWAPGIIKLQDGKTYFDSSVNYSTFDDRLFVKRNNLMYPVDYPVTEFTLQYADTNKALYFKNGFPAIEQNTSSSFYQVLADGKKIILLKRIRTQYQEVFNYGGRVEPVYSPVIVYYVFLTNQNKMIDMGMHINIKTLHKKLPGYSSEIDTYFSSNKINPGKDDALAGLFTFLDSTANK